MYQILGFSFFDKETKEFWNFRLTQEGSNNKLTREDVIDFLDLDIQNTEAYTLYK